MKQMSLIPSNLLKHLTDDPRNFVYPFSVTLVPPPFPNIEQLQNLHITDTKIISSISSLTLQAFSFYTCSSVEVVSATTWPTWSHHLSLSLKIWVQCVTMCSVSHMQIYCRLLLQPHFCIAFPNVNTHWALGRKYNVRLDNLNLKSVTEITETV